MIVFLVNHSILPLIDGIFGGVRIDGSINFDALRLEILQAQITFHWSATRTTYQFTCMTSHLKIKTCMYDVFS